jgi:cysteine desulfurase
MFPPKPKKIKTIYLDHAAATPMDARVLSAMKPFFLSDFANPSSLYSLGVKAKKAVEGARKNVADILFTQPDTICFTSGGTESNNMAIFGVAQKLKRGHIITSKIEHDSVLRGVEELERQGFEVTYLDVDSEGFVSPDQVKKALKKETVLVSLMYANNEIGTIEPIADIGREIVKWRKENKTAYPYFHTDACQAAGALELSVERLHVDLMTLNGSKMYGPKGVGILYKRRGVKFAAQMFGGRQEFGLRAGTENVAGIVGFGKALELVQEKSHPAGGSARGLKNKRLVELRDYFITTLSKMIPQVELNGPTVIASGAKQSQSKKIASSSSTPRSDSMIRLPNNVNLAFKNIEAEALMLYLDSYGIFCSTGSACSTESNEPSHVLMACGYSKERAESSLRFTMGKDTTKKDIDTVLKYLSAIVKEFRLLK